MYKLCFYVPASHLEEVKSAVFAAGAGQYKAYDQCCWQTLGEGQFRPLENSDPFIGSKPEGSFGSIEKVEEYKVEMICSNNKIKASVAALQLTHPYEEPAYQVFLIVDM